MNTLLILIRRRAFGLIALVLGTFLLAACSGEPPGAVQAGQGQSAPGAEAAQAAELQEITLAVPGMDCPMCPITVRRALSDVPGVVEATADLGTKEAWARFDPARTGAEALIAAVRNSGFSASVKETSR
jgi:mercuric transport protein